VTGFFWLGATLADESERKRLNADDDSSSHAADEPTAVWDVNALREAGLAELIKKPGSDDSDPPPPATPGVRSAQGPSIVVDEAAAGARARPGPPSAALKQGGAAASGELGWVATLGLAAGLGAAVYALIRFLK
jgi:hypothetical protein